MERDVALVAGEIYHIFNRGAHKQTIFTNPEDYNRFLLLLYLSNGTKPIVMRDVLSKYRGRTSVDPFVQEKPKKNLVEIFAYCLMPNHFHLVLRQKEDQGITKFLRRVSTGYSMYFNTKYKHSGTLFQGKFKSSHIDTDPYFRYIFAYVHLNPLEVLLPDWKSIKDANEIRIRMGSFVYSSYYDYTNKDVRPERAILSYEQAPEFLRKQNDLEELLAWHTEVRPLYGDKGLI